jgi:hypothetical protein
MPGRRPLPANSSVRSHGSAAEGHIAHAGSSNRPSSRHPLLNAHGFILLEPQNLALQLATHISYTPSVPGASQVLKILIASPGDANPGRDAAKLALDEWNSHRSDAEGVILRPLMWETGSVPLVGRGDTQSVINGQLVDEADIVIALFYYRLGSATPRAASGTAEEIMRSVAAGKPVHLYFAHMPIPPGFDVEQYKALQDFKREVQRAGLIGEFASEEDLGRKVSRALEYDIRELKGATRSTPGGAERERDELLQELISLRKRITTPSIEIIEPSDGVGTQGSDLKIRGRVSIEGGSRATVAATLRERKLEIVPFVRPLTTTHAPSAKWWAQRVVAIDEMNGEVSGTVHIGSQKHGTGEDFKVVLLIVPQGYIVKSGTRFDDLPAVAVAWSNMITVRRLS